MSRTFSSVLYPEDEPEEEEEVDIPISEASISDLEEAFEASGKVLEDDIQDLVRATQQTRDIPLFRWNVTEWDQHEWV